MEERESEARPRRGGASPGAERPPSAGRGGVCAPREDGKSKGRQAPRRKRDQGASDEKDGDDPGEKQADPDSELVGMVSVLRRENKDLRKMLRDAGDHAAAQPAPETPGAGAGARAGAGEEASRERDVMCRLAITKLSAQLKAATEKCRSEKEALQSTGERADQVNGKPGSGEGDGTRDLTQRNPCSDARVLGITAVAVLRIYLRGRGIAYDLSN